MKPKAMLQATLASGLTMWLLAGLWHEVLAAAFYRQHTGASHAGTGIILVAYLVLAALMVYLYPRAATARSVRQDVSFGVAVGLLWVFPHELAMAGAHEEPLGYVFRNAAWHVIEQGVGGVIIGWAHRRALVSRS